MGQIIVTLPNTTTVKLGTSSPVVVITRAEQTWGLMEEDKVEIDVESAVVLGISIGSYITVYGRRYIIYQLPELEKEGERIYKYKYVFQGAQYILQTVQLKLNRSGFTATTEFDLMGQLGDFLTCINIAAQARGINLNTSCPATSVKSLSFSGDNCLDVLNKLADEFEMEWKISLTDSLTNTYQLTFLAKVGTSLIATDIFSMLQGINKLARKNAGSNPLVTRLYAMGSDKNLPSGYRNYSPRLLTGSTNYIENSAAKALYGVFEFTKIFDDIFPSRTGTVSSLGANEFTFLDSSMDFDLNATSGGNTLYLIPNTAPKIHFQTGKLAGYEFGLKSYDHATKTFIIAGITDERGLAMPNSTNTEFKIAVGDTYKILDICLPSSYVTAAETALQSAASTFLNANCNPQIQYDLEMDEHWISTYRHGRPDETLYAPGDTIHINDNALGLSTDLRIIELVRDVFRPYKYKFTVASSQYRKPAYRLVTKFKNVVGTVGAAIDGTPGAILLNYYNNQKNIHTNVAND